MDGTVLSELATLLLDKCDQQFVDPLAHFGDVLIVAEVRDAENSSTIVLQCSSENLHIVLGLLMMGQVSASR